MAEELKPEEKQAADEIDISAAEGKTQLEQINENVTDVSDMLKSHVENLEKPENPPAEEETPFDIKSVTPEDFAKSIGGTKEERVDFIKRLVDSCNLMPQDMIDEDSGDQFFTDEMIKSMEGETSAVQGFMAGTMFAMQEANERTAKKDSLIFQTMLDMSKSIADLAAVVTEQNEKLEKSMPTTTEIVPSEVENPLPDLDGTSTKPISEQVDLGGEQSTLTPEVMSKAIKMAWPGHYGDIVELKLQNQYIDWLSKMTPEEVLGSMSTQHKDMVVCHI
ncbi:hypothetical protein KAR91_29545 [Candidatus Pacearchaeota archaeon]|nr:hypothetical protein [Candidatus Pacearchaeota archaeon]